jgi:serine/threonine-protein kinase
VHRDLKPSNVLLAADGPRVIDFGVARAVDHPAGAELTRAGWLVGSPGFMSPEQVLGDEAVDARSDIYALGCVAYWLLTGTPVFSGETSLNTMMMQVSVTPEPPSHRSGRAFPPELEALVLACLAKEPAARPQSVDEMVGSLDAVPLAGRWDQVEANRWWASVRPGNAP